MSAEHTPEHEELLQLHLLREEGDEPVELPADCPRCRERLAELEILMSSLGGAASLERGVMDEADALAAAPGEEQVEHFVRRDLAGGQGERWHGGSWLLVAAGLLFLSVAGWRWIQSSNDERDRVTLGGTEQGTSPVGEVADYDGFRWEGELPTGGWFAVRVLDLDDELLDESEQLGVNAWSPPTEIHTAWPDRILWQVRTYDGTGNLVGSLEEEAWRSSD